MSCEIPLVCEPEDQDVVRAALRQTLAHVQVLARKDGLRVECEGRLKSAASVSRKMAATGRYAHQILDIIGIRVIAEETIDCYRVARRIHAEMVPLQGQYDDYIAAPKANGYQSIHTTVVSRSGYVVEIQIRTRQMNEQCERRNTYARYQEERSGGEAPAE